MLRLIAFAAFAFTVATSAQAMPRVPLHEPDGMITQVRYYGYGHRRYGYGGYRHYGYGGYGHYGYRHYGHGVAAAKCAGARCGAQGTFAVDGIDTPEPVSGIRRGRPPGRPYLIWKGHRLPMPRRFPRHGLSSRYLAAMAISLRVAAH